MAIRFPLQVVLSQNNNDEVGAGSVNGVVAGAPFLIPQDTDNVTVKMTATTAGGGVSAQLQTTDDGGTTWYGVGRTSTVSAATGDAAQWFSVSVNGNPTRTGSVVAVGSVTGSGIVGSAAPSTLAAYGGLTGLPILGPTARIVIQMQAGITSSSILTQVKINSQSASA